MIDYIYPTDEYGDLDTDLVEQAYDLARSVGIHVMTDREPSWMAVHDGEVVGAIFTSFIGRDFTFDTVVDPAWQRKRIGSKLIDLGVQEFEEYRETDPDAELILDVVNRAARRILERKGFVVIEKIAGDRVLMS